MASGIRKSTRGKDTVYLEKVGVWYNPKSKEIHISVPRSKWFITTVSNKATSDRYHRNLFRKLAQALKEAGMPGPEVPAKP